MNTITIQPGIPGYGFTALVSQNGSEHDCKLGDLSDLKGEFVIKVTDLNGLTVEFKAMLLALLKRSTENLTEFSKSSWFDDVVSSNERGDLKLTIQSPVKWSLFNYNDTTVSLVVFNNEGVPVSFVGHVGFWVAPKKVSPEITEVDVTNLFLSWVWGGFLDVVTQPLWIEELDLKVNGNWTSVRDLPSRSRRIISLEGFSDVRYS